MLKIAVFAFLFVCLPLTSMAIVTPERVFPIENLSAKLQPIALKVLKRTFEMESLYTLLGGEKPITVIENDREIMELLAPLSNDEIRKLAEALSFPGEINFIFEYDDRDQRNQAVPNSPQGESLDSVNIYVVNRKKLKETIRLMPGYFQRYEIFENSPVQHIILKIKGDSNIKLRLGYPYDPAVINQAMTPVSQDLNLVKILAPASIRKLAKDFNLKNSNIEYSPVLFSPGEYVNWNLMKGTKNTRFNIEKMRSLHKALYFYLYQMNSHSAGELPDYFITTLRKWYCGPIYFNFYTPCSSELAETKINEFSQKSEIQTLLRSSVINIVEQFSKVFDFQQIGEPSINAETMNPDELF